MSPTWAALPQASTNVIGQHRPKPSSAEVTANAAWFLAEVSTWRDISGSFIALL